MVRQLEALINSATMFDGVEGDDLARVIHPEEHSPVADPILLESAQIGWEMLKGMSQRLWMCAEPPELFANLTSRRRVEPFEVPVESRSGLKLVHQAGLLAGPHEWMRFACEVFATSAPQLLHQGRLAGNEEVFKFLVQVLEDDRRLHHFRHDTRGQTDRSGLGSQFHGVRTIAQHAKHCQTSDVGVVR